MVDQLCKTVYVLYIFRREVTLSPVRWSQKLQSKPFKKINFVLPTESLGVLEQRLHLESVL